MKKVCFVLFLFATGAASYSVAQVTTDPKAACYKRCMDEIGEKPQCEYICYNKKQ